MEPFVMDEKQNEFRKELTSLINRHSRENVSDTPDFILAEYLTDCLAVFDRTTRERERWYGRYVDGKPGSPGHGAYPRTISDPVTAEPPA